LESVIKILLGECCYPSPAHTDSLSQDETITECLIALWRYFYQVYR